LRGFGIWLAVMAFVPAALAQSAGLRIVDPVAGAYVSGEYEVVLEAGPATDFVNTRLFLNDALVRETEGWQPTFTIDFGPEVVANALRAEVETKAGDTLVSEVVRTQALRIDYVETSRAILISAVVKNRRKQHLTDLMRHQFQVFEDGQLLEIQSFHNETLPLDLVMVLDTSSSLREGIEDLKRAAEVFLSQLGPGDLVSLFEIKNEPLKIQNFTSDRKLLRQQIGAMLPLGQTALFDGLKAALDDLPDKRRGRKTIVLFTDGRDSVYEEPRKKAYLLRSIITEAQNKEVTLFTIGQGKRINEAALTRMAEETGGRFLYAEHPGKLTEVFEEIILDLKHQYVLGVLPNSRRSGFHRLEVEVKKRGAKVYARKGYTLTSP